MRHTKELDRAAGDNGAEGDPPVPEVPSAHSMQSSAAAFRRKRRQCSEGGFAVGEEALTECRGAWEQGSAGNADGAVLPKAKKRHRNAVARETPLIR